MKTIEGIRKIKITFEGDLKININFITQKATLLIKDLFSDASLEIELTAEDLSIINGFSNTNADTNMPVLQETLPAPEKKDEKKGGGESGV